MVWFALIAMSACSEPTEPANVLELSSGTSFGECVGYCITELIVAGSTARFVESAHASQALPPRTRTLTLSGEEAERLYHAVDVAEMKHVEGVHGCPDCADGGAEWIQLRTPEDTIRVTFELGRTVRQIAELQTEIRRLRARFSEIAPPPVPTAPRSIPASA
jgi:hypothetical protein